MTLHLPFHERYEARSSPLHRADARVKLVATVAYIFAVTLTPFGAWTALLLLAAPLVPAAAASRLSPWLVLRRSMLALPFVLAAVPLAFTREGPAVFSVPLLGWDASETGLTAVATILAKSWLSVTAAVLLTASTPAVELIRALRALRVPRLLVATVQVMYRHIFVIGEEAARLTRARDSRSGARPGYRSGGTLWWRARVLGNMVGSLFLRSYERSERVYAAMLARGYDGEPRLLDRPAVRLAEAAAAALLVAYALGVQWYARA
ncbi:MAG TPA: cobalt ECF transporter T component CbiQ [Dehalococcoidia bacterium]